MQADTSLLSRAANKVFTIFALVFHFHTYLLLVNTRLEKCLKCESASSCFQPGEGPSRGLLRDCENRWIIWRSTSSLVSCTLAPWSQESCQHQVAGLVLKYGQHTFDWTVSGEGEGGGGESGENQNWIFGRKENCNITLHCSDILILEGWPWSEVESACVPTAGKHHCFWSGENQWS